MTKIINNMFKSSRLLMQVIDRNPGILRNIREYMMDSDFDGLLSFVDLLEKEQKNINNEKIDIIKQKRAIRRAELKKLRENDEN